jgi:HAMP domain-containing protein
MHIRTKFNLILITVFAIGLITVVVITDTLLQNNARQVVTDNARLMIDAALATRHYTEDQITPLLMAQNQHRFLPQSIPFYAATETFHSLQKKYPAYSYKEATLNPTNPRDQATDWETDVINKFRNSRNTQEIVGTRSTPMGETLFLSHPVVVTDETCLHCHSTPAAAPKSLVQTYGPDHGFNWHMGDVVGAQIVSVPTAVPEAMAQQASWALIGSMVAVFLITLLVLNVMLTLIVIRPVTRLSQVAERISKGSMDSADIPVQGKDEIADLATSFNRMQRSLRKAVSMLEDD